MANPIGVKGIRRIIDQVSDEVMQAAKKAADEKLQRVGGAGFDARGSVSVNGNFGFDRKGNFGLVANVIGSTPAGELVGGAELEAGVDASTAADWTSVGAGTLQIHYSVRIHWAGTKQTA